MSRPDIGKNMATKKKTAKKATARKPKKWKCECAVCDTATARRGYVLLNFPPDPKRAAEKRAANAIRNKEDVDAIMERTGWHPVTGKRLDA